MHNEKVALVSDTLSGSLIFMVSSFQHFIKMREYLIWPPHPDTAGEEEILANLKSNRRQSIHTDKNKMLWLKKGAMGDRRR